jgi:hypothetical protein
LQYVNSIVKNIVVIVLRTVSRAADQVHKVIIGADQAGIAVFKVVADQQIPHLLIEGDADPEAELQPLTSKAQIDKDPLDLFHHAKAF